MAESNDATRLVKVKRVQTTSIHELNSAISCLLSMAGGPKALSSQFKANQWPNSRSKYREPTAIRGHAGLLT